jgi:hypothetical protein
MSKQAELDFPFEIEVSNPILKERIVKDCFVTIDGKDFDLFDLKSLLDEASFGVVITDNKTWEMLKKYEVFRTRGGRDIPACRGHNFDKFRTVISEKMKQYYDGDCEEFKCI